ncbi:hypothetical protein [Kutzneria buriramensis]|uniref:Uncharacterized protein n=1 Tax=Kutzneria buriramensis TaxID=1045776 RepID=A0A3E0H0S5_9PSEU|nr:hypothetical protein [Kutzneria buriramensis]REH35153.1 hypothetical protein BCF44_11813 [Kutzneria buriramensis]
MTINWAGLGAVFLVALVASVLFVGLFSVGIASWTRRGEAAVNNVLAIVCFVLCAGIIGYGIFAIAHK